MAMPRLADRRIASGWRPILLAVLFAVSGNCGDDDDEGATFTSGSATTGATPAPSTSAPNGATTGITTSPETLAPLVTDPPNNSGTGGFGLPDGPFGPGNDHNRDIYQALHDGDCAGAAEALDRRWESDNEEQRPIRSQRDVLIFQAAIDLCAGHSDRARAWLNDARQLGLQGLATPVRTSDDDVPFFAWYCEVYRSLVSALEGESRQSVTCPGGEPPAWPSPRDDPRTSADESAVTTSDPDGTDGSTTSSSQTSPPATVDSTAPVTSGTSAPSAPDTGP